MDPCYHIFQKNIIPITVAECASVMGKLSFRFIKSDEGESHE